MLFVTRRRLTMPARVSLRIIYSWLNFPLCLIINSQAAGGVAHSFRDIHYLILGELRPGEPMGLPD